jgi:hypothetical protein
MRRLILALAPLALALVASPGTAAARTVAFRGTVVARSAVPVGYVVAARSGRLRLVRTAARLRVGRRVAVRGRVLADRSVRATRVRRLGLATAPLPVGAAVAVEFSGTVVSAGGGKLLLSIGGIVLVIQAPASVDVSSLTRGAAITVRVAIGTNPAGVTTLTLLAFRPATANSGAAGEHHPPHHHRKPRHHKPRHHKPRHHGHHDHHGHGGGDD